MDLGTLLDGFLHTQENRLFTLRSPRPEAGLLLNRFSGTEEVSAPFKFTLELLSERGDLEPDDFLGQPMGVALRTAAGSRSFHGHVAEFRHTGSDGGLAHYQAELAPWTEFLRHRVCCRLFLNRTLAETLAAVFGAYGHLARYELRFRQEAHKPVTLCAQYQESDFQFVSRLLEAAGIHYFFRFEEDGHVLVLADDSGLAPALPGQPGIAFNTHPGAAREDGIDAWREHRRLVPTACAGKTFDFKSPRDPMAAGEASALATGGLPAMEDYRYAGAYAFPDLEAGARRARLRMEAFESGARTFEGASNCRALAAGHRFELFDHYRQGPGVLERSWFITQVAHEGRNNHLSQAAPADYRNSFVCIPLAVPYRPAPVTARPLIHGPQTAIVTGPEGEEIFCDRYGRVLVQFHWDREGRFDQASSCWVRVASPWGGGRFGFIAVPRVGQEVVVEFLDGDPDRPLVTGHVWNEARMPPWELPEHRSQTGLLTRSSKDGEYGNANALRFEDAKGAEEVWLHAERDQLIEVEHDERHQVDHDRRKRIGNDETTEVGHDRSETVVHDETIAVGHDRRERVGGDEAIEVAGDRREVVGGDEDLRVEGEQSLAVGKSQTITVAMAKTESVTLASSEFVGAARSLSVGGGYAVVVGAEKFEHVAGNSVETIGGDRTTLVAAKYAITVTEQFDLTVGSSRLTLTKDGVITLAGKQVNILAEGPLKLSGKDIEAN